MHPAIPGIIAILSAASGFLPDVNGMRRRALGVGSVIASVTAILVAAPVLFSGTPLVWGPILIDRFGAYVICLIALVAGLAALAGVHYLDHGRKEGSVTASGERIFCIFFPLFLLSMLTVAAADNLALIWIALESTTLTTTLLVDFDRTRGAIEAAWKYLIICSTGITLGLLGVLMIIHAAAGADLGAGAFSFSSLLTHAGLLSTEPLRWAFVFLFVGVGTKVGFVPMHTWLPDAHSKTPSPVSAMLSGILLNVAFAVLLRAKGVVDASLGSSGWTGSFFLVFGMMSIALPAFILLVQKNFKRMLAYSSIEHMGLMSFAVGLGPIGTFAAIIHMAGHALAKPALFFGAGELLHEFRSSRIAEVRDAYRRRPKTGALFFIALLALLGAPPSALFVSEYLMASYGMTTHPALTLVVLVLLVIVAFGIMRSVVEMLFSKETDEHATRGPRMVERWNLTTVAMGTAVVLCAVLGLVLLSGPGLRFFGVLAQSIS